MAEITHADVARKLQVAINTAGSRKALAHKLGVTPQYISDVLKWKQPGPKILDELELESVTTTVYREKE